MQQNQAGIKIRSVSRKQVKFLMLTNRAQIYEFYKGKYRKCGRLLI